VVLMFALLVTQAASFVCGAQCLQHQQPNAAAAAMTHCHAMHSSTMGITGQTCPSTATAFCVTDLLVNSQQINTPQTTIYVDVQPTVQLPVSTVAARTTAIPPQRSTIGDPPLLTPLRV
jgi:hypothetical protein